MYLIAAVDSNWGIGKNNELLFTISDDMKQFKEKTLDTIVVMGRKTFDSLIYKPLQKRINIVLSTKDLDIPPEFTNVIVMHSVEDIISYCGHKTAYCIGGSSIYKQFLPYCSIAFITKVQKEFNADAYFPNLDNDPEWREIKQSPEFFDKETDLKYQFKTYKKF